MTTPRETILLYHLPILSTSTPSLTLYPLYLFTSLPLYPLYLNILFTSIPSSIPSLPLHKFYLYTLFTSTPSSPPHPLYLHNLYPHIEDTVKSNYRPSTPQNHQPPPPPAALYARQGLPLVGALGQFAIELLENYPFLDGMGPGTLTLRSTCVYFLGLEISITIRLSTYFRLSDFSFQSMHAVVWVCIG